MDEFFRQGDLERSQGLPLSPMTDREKTSTPMSQINFIEFIVAPLFAHVSWCMLLNVLRACWRSDLLATCSIKPMHNDVPKLSTQLLHALVASMSRTLICIAWQPAQRIRHGHAAKPPHAMPTWTWTRHAQSLFKYAKAGRICWHYGR